MSENPYRPPATEIDIPTGYNFKFNIDGIEIKAGGSSFSGKEYVYLNNRLVSETRTHRKNSAHEFTLDGASYKIEFKMLNMIKGTLACSLFKDDILVKQYLATPRIIKDPGLVIGVVAAGILLFALADSFDLPIWVFGIAFIVAILVAQNHAIQHIEIKEVEIQQ